MWHHTLGPLSHQLGFDFSDILSDSNVEWVVDSNLLTATKVSPSDERINSSEMQVTRQELEQR